MPGQSSQLPPSAQGIRVPGRVSSFVGWACTSRPLYFRVAYSFFPPWRILCKLLRLRLWKLLHLFRRGIRIIFLLVPFRPLSAQPCPSLIPLQFPFSLVIHPISHISISISMIPYISPAPLSSYSPSLLLSY